MCKGIECNVNILILGLSGERQHSLSNRGRDGSCCSGSNGGAIVPTGNFPLSENNGKYDSEALLGRSSGTNNVSSQSVRERYNYDMFAWLLKP